MGASDHVVACSLKGLENLLAEAEARPRVFELVTCRACWRSQLLPRLDYQGGFLEAWEPYPPCQCCGATNWWSRGRCTADESKLVWRSVGATDAAIEAGDTEAARSVILEAMKNGVGGAGEAYYLSYGLHVGL